MNHASPDQTIVVTGIGLVTPLGADRETSWKALLDGASGVDGGAARCPAGLLHGPRAVSAAVAAAAAALADAGAALDDGDEWGCVVSSTKPILPGYLWPDRVPAAVARAFGVSGPVMNVASACATGAHSVMTGAEWIREGRCRYVLAGASESSLDPLYLAGFSQMGVLSESGRVRPFDRSRDGFIVGEGAAVFVLESEGGARERGARARGKLLGWDSGCDAHHATRFNSSGARMAGSLRRALARAGAAPESLDYVNAHGTATPLNDALEASALRSVFGARSGVSVSSTKGATGHLLGATGAVELAFSFLALRDGCAPPTLNLEEPECDGIDFVPKSARSRRLSTAASLSFGFGGSLASVVIGKA